MFVALKMEVYKLDINNVPTSMNNLRRKVDDLDVCKLKTVHKDFKKISDVIEVVRNTKFNTPKIKKLIWNRKLMMQLNQTLIHLN